MSGFELIVVLIVLLFWLALVSLMLRGWRNRGRRQVEAVGQLPTVPAELGEPEIGPHTGLYVGSTMAPSWQNRIAVGDIGDRATATYTGYPDGVLIDRNGASQIWIPRSAISAVRTENGLAGKVMSRDGVLVIRWTAPTGLQIDSGIRGDDKAAYPDWTGAYAEITAATRQSLEQNDSPEQDSPEQDSPGKDSPGKDSPGKDSTDGKKRKKS